MTADLIAEFEEEMYALYEEAKRPPCSYNAVYFLRMVREHGGVETARRLLATEQPQDGMTRLFMCNRLDLTLERHVLIPRYRGLFNQQTVNAARQRLEDLGHTVDEAGNLVRLDT